MTLQLCVMAPDLVVWDGPIEQAILPTTTGQIGVLKGHTPIVTALDIGVIMARTNTGWEAVILIGGFGLIKNDCITLLVNEAELGSNIELEKANLDFEEAKQALANATTRKDRVEANLQFKRARARYQAISPI
jgi:F-type H+-transporting ATPase subunit epsilon